MTSQVGIQHSHSTRSTGVSLQGEPCLEREPLRHIMVERNRQNERWHLSQLMMVLYGSSHLSEMNVAKHLYVMVAALPIPPEVLNMSGVNEPCSTSQIQCLYAWCFPLHDGCNKQSFLCRDTRWNVD